MTTSAQTRRNRQNAKHSTGPRTIEGKNRSRFNAVKHACTAKLVLLPEEKPAEFNRRTKGIFEHFLPQTQYEVDLAEAQSTAHGSSSAAAKPGGRGCMPRP